MGRDGEGKSPRPQRSEAAAGVAAMRRYRAGWQAEYGDTKRDKGRGSLSVAAHPQRLADLWPVEVLLLQWVGQGRGTGHKRQ